MRRLLAPILIVIAIALPTPAGAQPVGPRIGVCPALPADNIWNARVDALPVDARSSDYVASIGANTGLHPDFGTFYLGAPIGIPYVGVTGTQPKVGISFFPAPDGWADESDPGPMPIPADAPIEGGANATGDRHVLVVDQDACRLYELFNAHKQPDNSWRASSSAIFDLNANALRPAGWTSADAAGLPILPGLVRYDEVQAGEIRHALRFTASVTQRKYVWPARHFASSNTSATRPPMGQRFRLKASKDIGGFPPQVQVIFTAFKRYGLILADNGSNWYVSGAHDLRWDDAMLVSAFRQLKGSDFEAVDVSSLMISPDSGQVRAAAPPRATPWAFAPIVRR